ncbi:hypothetical protein CFH99_06805 [Nocardioides aromaticivorans]|uniref:SPW repeat-containing protein n=1 Tax=Nocardioides aromaticivorans TaxID=200618 RepID=A0ABX7PHG9_9ACTN|nr:hypothetical protein [Nocardioides aromaticivorans]QSR25331.1 hypothetical protein CFH99_06805 [Nocardioides aromaticivorans]
MAHLRRAPLAVLCLLGGAAVSTCAVLLHDYAWGLVLGVVTTFALLVALPPGWWSRLSFAVGWVVVLWQATTERPEGDYLVSSDVSGYALLLAGMVVLAGGFVGLVRRGRPAGDSGGVETAP